MDKNIVLAVILDLSVNGDVCSRPWIKTSKIMGTACCERE